MRTGPLACRLGSALVFTCLLVAASPDALAGACPAPQLRVHPGGGATAPTNVLVRLAFEAAEVAVYELVDERTRQIRKTGRVRASDVDVELRPEGGAAVPVTVRRPPATYRPLILLRPRRPLAARTRYVVILRTRTEVYIVSRFTTGDGVDSVAPTLGPVTAARFGRYPAAKHWKDPTGAWATVTLSGSTDAVGFEVHVLATGQTPTDATLRAILSRGIGSPVTVRLQDGGPCHSASFGFPPVPAGARTLQLRLGVRALDAAGNASPVREALVKILGTSGP